VTSSVGSPAGPSASAAGDEILLPRRQAGRVRTMTRRLVTLSARHLTATATITVAVRAAENVPLLCRSGRQHRQLHRSGLGGRVGDGEPGLPTFQPLGVRNPRRRRRPTGAATRTGEMCRMNLCQRRPLPATRCGLLPPDASIDSPPPQRRKSGGLRVLTPCSCSPSAYGGWPRRFCGLVAQWAGSTRLGTISPWERRSSSWPCFGFSCRSVLVSFRWSLSHSGSGR
jgi:hypothetical protein